MKTRLLFAPLLLAVVASLAACGGGSPSVPANAIAVVGAKSITTADFNAYFRQAQEISKTNGVEPQPGTPQYTAMRNQVVAYLVQVCELEQQAPKESVSVSQTEVTKYIAKLAKTSYGGSMARLTAALKKQGISMRTARQEVYVNRLAEKIHTKVTKTAQATTAAAKAYYELHISDYKTAAQTTRSVAYILVKSKALVYRIEQKLVNGASFEAMAKKYSTDSTTSQGGGKYTATKGQLVPAYDKVAFALKTGDISEPVDATSAANNNYGWFIIKALGPVVHQKAHTKSFKDVEAEIKQTISQQAVDALWSQWLSDLKKEYEGKVTYQAGYAPPATTALPTTT